VYLVVRRAVSMVTAQHQMSALVIQVCQSILAFLFNKCLSTKYCFAPRIVTYECQDDCFRNEGLLEASVADFV
jgi:hypothetical protein